MGEYLRTETHQFCDTELCMVLDTVTGKPERAFEIGNSIGSFSEALEYLKNKKGWEDRTIIVKLNCVQGFKIERKA